MEHCFLHQCDCDQRAAASAKVAAECVQTGAIVMTAYVKMLLSAHVITSDLTRPLRSRVIEELQKRVSEISKTPLKVVDAHDEDSMRSHLVSLRGDKNATASLIDLDPKNMEDEGLRSAVAPMQIRSLSNAMKHYQALLDGASCAAGVDDKKGWSLILEDDAVFNAEALTDSLRKTMENAPEDADIIFLGLPSRRNKQPEAEQQQQQQQQPEFDDANDIVKTQVLPACDSYLVSAAAIERVADAFLPIRFMTNIHLSWLIRNKGLRAYVAVPNVFVDGSKLGSFVSTLNPNNQLVWNQAYCVLSLHLERKQLDEFGALWESQADIFKSHPDALVLLADWHAASDRPSDAERVYGQALATYEANKCIVGSQSRFMQRYMKTYGKLQV